MFKIKVYLHNSIQATLTDDFAKVIAYFKDHNVDIVFDFQQTDVNKDNALMWLMQPQQGLYDCVMYIYNRGCFQMQTNGLTFRIAPNLVGVYLATSTTDDAVGYSWKSISHEIMHCLFMKYTNTNGNVPMDAMIVNGILTPYYQNENLYAKDGNFARAWELLSPYIKPKCKYFKESEIVGLKPQLVAMLDKAREIAGVPFKITSGQRSPSQNELVGGVSDSSHLSGYAVDLAVADGVIGGKILLALIQVGFKRFGFYKDGHIHVDCEPSKPSPCYWVK